MNMKRLTTRFLLFNWWLFCALKFVMAGTPDFSTESDPLNELFNSVFSVKKFGAVGDGQSNDTRAIQETIDCSHNSGGGIVYFPPGTFLTGTLVLKDNVTLFLSSGSVLLGSSNLADYQPLNCFTTEIPAELGHSLERDLGGLHLIYAEQATNIGISGNGRIDGQGPRFWDENYAPLNRPHQMIQFEACQDVFIQDVTLQNSPFWTLHLLGCDNVKIQNITINNHRWGPNTDGIDINSSSNILISNCYIDSGDDCICLKARLQTKPCENVTVSNCVLASNHSALKLGTHSLGDIRHCIFNNCVIRNTYLGIGIYMKDGGAFEDIKFTDLTIDLQNAGNNQREVFPIVIDLEKRTNQVKIGSIRNITFSNININTRGRCLISGFYNQPIEDLMFDNFRMHIPVCDEITTSQKPRGIINVMAPVPGTDYSHIPSHFIFSHVKNLTLRDLQLEVENYNLSTERHAVWGISLEGVTINGFRASPGIPDRQLATFYFEQTKHLFITGCQASPYTRTFIQLKGDETENINIIGNDIHFAQEAFQLAPDLKADTFFQTANRLP